MCESSRYVDIHVHANPCSAEGFTLDRLAAWMDANGVGRHIVQQLAQSTPQNALERQVEARNFGRYRGSIWPTVPASGCCKRTPISTVTYRPAAAPEQSAAIWKPGATS
jgi:hypothetical protein